MDQNQLNNQIPADQTAVNQPVDQISAEEQELSKVLDSINQQVDQQAAMVEEETKKAEQNKEASLADELNQEDDFDPMAQFAELNKQLEEVAEEKENQQPEATHQAENQPTEVENQPESPEIAGFAPVEQNTVDLAEQTPAPVEQSPIASVEQVSTPVVDADTFEGLKKAALKDLRPLIDKLNLSDQEKFEIHLLLIRSTDDQSLLEPAYQAAREIEDESERAKALLDVVKEIDYFASKK